MNVSKIPASIANDIRQRGHSDEDIARMSPFQAFEEYCNWNGLISWGGDLWRAVEALQKAEKG